MTKRIRIITKSNDRAVVISDRMDDATAEKHLDELTPRIGKEGAYQLPGLVVNTKEIISAETFDPPNSYGGRRP